MESLFLQQILNGIVIGSIYGVIAIGLTMIFGVMNICNFAHGDYAMVGAYVAVGLMATVPTYAAASLQQSFVREWLEKHTFRPVLSSRTHALCRAFAKLLRGTARRSTHDLSCASSVAVPRRPQTFSLVAGRSRIHILDLQCKCMV